MFPGHLSLLPCWFLYRPPAYSPLPPLPPLYSWHLAFSFFSLTHSCFLSRPSPPPHTIVPFLPPQLLTSPLNVERLLSPSLTHSLLPFQRAPLLSPHSLHPHTYIPSLVPLTHFPPPPPPPNSFSPLTHPQAGSPLFAQPDPTLPMLYTLLP